MNKTTSAVRRKPPPLTIAEASPPLCARMLTGDKERVRAQNASNTTTPAPQTSESPTFDDGRPSPFSYFITGNLNHRTIFLRAFAVLLLMLTAVGCNTSQNDITPPTPIVVERIVVVTATPSQPAARAPADTPVPAVTLAPSATQTPPPPTVPPAATVTSTPTPRPTAMPPVCVLPSQLEMAARGNKVSCVTPTPPPGTTPTPLPTEAEKEFCLKAAANIQLLLRGEHPKQSEFTVFGKNKFSEVVKPRPVAGPNRCFGEVLVRNPLDDSVRSRDRIVFSNDWFKSWNPAEHGNWQ